MTRSTEAVRTNELREAVARIIEPERVRSVEEMMAENARVYPWWTEDFSRGVSESLFTKWTPRREDALAKADAILSLLETSSSSSRSQPSAGPQGEWVLVPREPTEEMCLLGLQELPFGPSSPDNARRCYRAMLGAAPASPASGWRPIESAPRDGTWLLLLNSEQFCQSVTDDADEYAARVGVGRWDMEAAKYHPHHPAWRSLHEHTEWFAGSELTGSWDVTETEVLSPTHWMPLPDPPPLVEG